MMRPRAVNMPVLLVSLLLFAAAVFFFVNPSVQSQAIIEIAGTSTSTTGTTQTTTSQTSFTSQTQTTTFTSGSSTYTNTYTSTSTTTTNPPPTTAPAWWLTVITAIFAVTGVVLLVKGIGLI